MKILCCGDRNWQNVEIIRRELRQFPPGTEVVEGEARGADALCRMVARDELGFTVHRHPAKWTLHGRSAGPRRNSEMLDKHPDIQLVLAFHEHIEQSKGTADMCKKALKRGIEVRVIDK